MSYREHRKHNNTVKVACDVNCSDTRAIDRLGRFVVNGEKLNMRSGGNYFSYLVFSCESGCIKYIV